MLGIPCWKGCPESPEGHDDLYLSLTADAEEHEDLQEDSHHDFDTSSDEDVFPEDGARPGVAAESEDNVDPEDGFHSRRGRGLHCAEIEEDPQSEIPRREQGDLTAYA